MSRRFCLVDVFGEHPLLGNPLGVVIDSEGLSTSDMQDITRWLNLSETTFLVPPESEGADYGVRIFTLAGELPFAGHPTLGTCHVWSALEARGGREVIQECGAGLVPIRPSDGRLAFRAPAVIRGGPVDAEHLAMLADVLGIDVSDVEVARWVDNGPGWVGILLGDAAEVLALEPDFSRGAGRDALDIGVVGFHRGESGPVYEVRAFFTGDGGRMVEDPVTGSLNASVAQWLLDEGRVSAPYVASQGTRLGRAGRVHISRDDSGAVWVGGNTFTIVEGVLDF